MISSLIHTAVEIVIGWLLVKKIPQWLDMTGIIGTAIKVVGVLVIISALLDWI